MDSVEGMDGSVKPQLAPAAASALTSATRLAVVLLCEREPQSNHGLAQQLGLPAGHVRHHVTELERGGVIHAVAEEPVRGGTRTFYRTVYVGWADAIESLNALALGREAGA